MKRFVALAFAFAIATSAPTLAAPPFPDTPKGRVAAAYLEAINSGRDEAVRSFLSAHASKRALADRPIEDRVTGLRGVRQEHGRLTPVRLLEETKDEVRMLARNDHGGTMEIGFLFEPEAPHDFMGMRVLDVDSQDAAPTPAPAVPKAGSDEGAVRSFAAHLDSLARADAFSGAVLVAKHDRVLLREAYGMASRADRTPNTPETRFNLGSINKVFTKLAIGQLVSQGKVSLDATIDRYLPDYPREAARKVTVRHLLEHRGGVADIFGAEYEAADKAKLRDVSDWIPLFRDKPLAFEPGSRQQYSNGGYVLLGAIVEKASGESYYDYLRRHVYGPLGLRNTDHYANDEKVPGRADGYTKRGGSEAWTNNQGSRPMRGSPAGGGYSTVDDLLAFARAVRGGKLLPQELEKDFRELIPLSGAPPAMMFGGGAPGINASVSMEGPYTIIVLANLDPPAAEQAGARMASLLGISREGRGRGVRVRPAGHLPPALERAEARASRAPRKVSVPAKGVSVEMLRSNHLPVVLVMVNGKGPFRFGIDTGAAGSARLDSALVAQLGLAKIGQVRGGDPSGRNARLMDLVAIESLQIGGARFENLDAAVRNYNERSMGDAIDGILGFGLFEQCLFTLDYPGNRVRIERGELPAADGRDILPFRNRNGVPSVTLQVDSLRMEADVDAGSMGGFSLPASFVEKLALASEPRVIGRGRTVSNEFEIQSATLRGTVRLGGNEYPDPTITFQPIFPMANVGSRVLKDFEVTFDQKNGRMRLLRGEA